MSALVATGMVALTGVAMMVVYKLAEIIIRPPSVPNRMNPKNFGFDFEAVRFEGESGQQLSGWWIAAAAPSPKTIICCHGWGTNRSDILPATEFLAKEGFNLFYFDFRGCGESPRWGYSSLGLVEAQDLAAAVRYLKTVRPDHCRWLGIYGLSMGGVAALGLAAGPQGNKIQAIVVESSYLSFKQVLERYIRIHFGLPEFFALPYLAMLYWRTRPADHESGSPSATASKMQVPKLFLLYGKEDRLSPPSDAQAISRLINPSRTIVQIWICPDADHAKCFSLHPEEYRRQLGGFFRRAAGVAAAL